MRRARALPPKARQSIIVNMLNGGRRWAGSDDVVIHGHRATKLSWGIEVHPETAGKEGRIMNKVRMSQERQLACGADLINDHNDDEITVVTVYTILSLRRYRPRPRPGFMRLCMCINWANIPPAPAAVAVRLRLSQLLIWSSLVMSRYYSSAAWLHGCCCCCCFCCCFVS